MDDQQRARELAHKIGVYYTRKGSTALEDGFFGFTETELQEFAAALRAAPEVVRIAAADGLDPITVYADDLGEGRGRLTVCCYAGSWSYTAAWGAMGGSLHAFVAGLNPHYLADNLLWPNAVKLTKHQRQYVERIAAAVIAAFADRPQEASDA